MRTDSVKKYVIPNIPYLFIGWACLKLGTAYRLAPGVDLPHKLMGLGQTIGPAFADFAPGLDPLDWLIGILSNTFNIVMAVFDVSQSVIAQAGGLIQGSTDITPDMLAELETTLEGMDLGPLLGLWLQSSIIGVTMWALGIVIFVLVYGRMLEIYILTSLAPIPMATISHREVGQIGQNYLRSLFAVGFQGMLILVCVAIYAVLIQGIATGGDPIGAIWGIVGYTVLLCFMLFKTGSIARSIFNAH